MGEYAKLFALGSVKVQDVKTMGEFAKLPITWAYTHYMLHVGQNGTLSELVTALLPCMWSYWEIGKELSKIPGSQEHELYGEWVHRYA